MTLTSNDLQILDSSVLSSIHNSLVDVYGTGRAFVGTYPPESLDFPPFLGFDFTLLQCNGFGFAGRRAIHIDQLPRLFLSTLIAARVDKVRDAKLLKDLRVSYEDQDIEEYFGLVNIPWPQSPVKFSSAEDPNGETAHAKSTLNELLSTYGCEQPSYTTSIAGPEHSQSFTSTLTLQLPDGSPKKFRSSPFGKKKTAEANAAIEALRFARHHLFEGHPPLACEALTAE